MADYRIRGYMQYEGVAGGNGNCSDSFIAACANPAAHMEPLILTCSP
jgi:hypothetical protein